MPYHCIEKREHKRIGIKKDNFRCPIWPTSTALNQGQDCPLEDTWKCLEKCLFVVKWSGARDPIGICL